MILFVTGQYAGAQYIHPLIKKWSNNPNQKWQLVATGMSRKYWDEHHISYLDITNATKAGVSGIFESVRPSLVLLSTSATIAQEYIFIQEAKERKVPSVSFIDNWNNYTSRFNYNNEQILPDYILAIDERCQEELVATGIPEELVEIVGQPYLESLINNEPALGENILISSQPISKFYNKKMGYDELDFIMLCIQAVKNQQLENIYVTTHPDEKNISAPECYSKVKFSPGKGNIDIANSHTVFGMFSMQMIIGFLWGRKVASVQPGLNTDDPSPLSRWGDIPRLETVTDIENFICQPGSVNNRVIKQGLYGSTDRLEQFCLCTQQWQ